MSEVKHTPTPWEYDCESDFIIDDNGDYICSMDIGYSCSEMEEKEANAHLIAAAPDLYECLEFLCSWLENQGFGESSEKALPGEYDYAIEVLAKARGETSA